jgi:hypothetical protein
MIYPVTMTSLSFKGSLTGYPGGATGIPGGPGAVKGPGANVSLRPQMGIMIVKRRDNTPR